MCTHCWWSIMSEDLLCWLKYWAFLRVPSTSLGPPKNVNPHPLYVAPRVYIYVSVFISVTCPNIIFGDSMRSPTFPFLTSAVMIAIHPLGFTLISLFMTCGRIQVQRLQRRVHNDTGLSPVSWFKSWFVVQLSSMSVLYVNVAASSLTFRNIYICLFNSRSYMQDFKSALVISRNHRRYFRPKSAQISSLFAYR